MTSPISIDDWNSFVTSAKAQLALIYTLKNDLLAQRITEITAEQWYQVTSASQSGQVGSENYSLMNPTQQAEILTKLEREIMEDIYLLGVKRNKNYPIFCRGKL